MRVPARIAGLKDGIAVFATITSVCALRLAFWNGRDPILKERLFGLGWTRKAIPRRRQGILLLSRFNFPRIPTCGICYKFRSRNSLRSTGGLQSRTAPSLKVNSSMIDTNVFRSRIVTSISSWEYAQERRRRLPLAGLPLSNRDRILPSLFLMPTDLFRNTWAGGTGTPRPAVVSLRFEHPSELGEAASENSSSDETPTAAAYTKTRAINERLWNSPIHSALPRRMRFTAILIQRARSKRSTPTRQAPRASGCTVLNWNRADRRFCISA